MMKKTYNRHIYCSGTGLRHNTIYNMPNVTHKEMVNYKIPNLEISVHMILALDATDNCSTFHEQQEKNDLTS